MSKNSILLLGFFLHLVLVANAQTTLVSTSQITQLEVEKNDTIYVVNFWATWCKPCVKELPYFQQLQNNYRQFPLKVILVSVNRPSELHQVEQFLSDHHITVTSWLLNEKDPNIFIPAIAQEWSGAIPATMVYGPAPNDRQFFEKEFTYTSLNSIVQPLIHN